MPEMPRYRCHKVVRALRIDQSIKILPDGAAVLSIADGGFEPVRVDAKIMSRRWPMPGDYLVTYEDGYQSISPAKAFEAGYTRID